MAVSLVGEVVNSADATTGYNQGNISGDDDFVEGTGAIGLKASNTTVEIYTTSLGATAPYDFSSTGGEDGYHIICWFNTKTPINATTGLTIVVGNGTDRGRWNVLGSGFYKGGFVTRVINTAADFDTISAGTWTTTGNPAQLSNITQMGGGFTTITSIMGSFNNVQLDQFTIGLGCRADAGTVGTPNTFETVRSADEDTNYWGWWSSSNGAIIGKGKLYIGPATGSATSVFTDSAFAVVFADERVATGFYEIETRGAGTDVDWTLANISSADATVARWSLTIDSTTNSFSDTNGVWSEADVLTLDSSATLTGTTIISSNSIVQNGATLSACSFLSPNRTSGQSFITSSTSDLANITDCTFESSGTGHAIDLGTVSTTQSINWDNTDTGYTASSSGNETIRVSVNSGITLTINVVSGASTPSVYNTGAGTVNVVSGQVTLKVVVKKPDGTALTTQDANVLVEADAGGPLAVGTDIIKGFTDASGEISDTRSYASNQPITGWVRKGSASPYYKQADITGTVDSGNGLTITIQMVSDE